MFLLDAPSVAAGGAAGRSAAGGASAASTTVPTISLSNMKSRIATLEAEASAGGTPEYRECVENAYISLRVVTHAVEAAGGHLSLANVTLASGQPAGTLILEYPRSSDTPNPVWDLWHDGPDKDIVRGQIVNVRPATNLHARSGNRLRGAAGVEAVPGGHRHGAELGPRPAHDFLGRCNSK